MKFAVPIISSLIISCATVSADKSMCRLDDTDTVHIDNNHHIKLMKIDKNKINYSKFVVKQEGWDLFSAPKEKDYSKGISPIAHDLGMGNVPVLDQGQQGTCVTFSSTAALDAILNQGDFISQQCSLELDVGLGDNYWNGANMPSEIILPLKQYGVVSKATCPNKYPIPSAKMNSSDYVALVDATASAAIAKVNLSYNSSDNLVMLKQAIDSGHRVLIGFLINASYQQAVRGFNVVYEGKTYNGGGWFCSQGNSANYCTYSNAGHEVVVTGYDDEQQLLKIRNSWNTSVGINGDYVMSYQYFSKMAIDQSEIW